MSTTINNVGLPWMTLLVILGSAFVLGLLIRYQLRGSAGIRHAGPMPAIWIALSIGLGLLLVAAFAFTGTEIARSNSPPPGTQPPNANETPTASTMPNTSTSGANPFAAEEISAGQQEVVERNRLKLALIAVPLLFILAGILLVWNRLIRSRAPAAPVFPAVKSGLGWLLVPAICLAGLATLAAPKVVPGSRPARWNQPAISASQQERMDKNVRDLIDNPSRSGVSIENIPPWLKYKSLSSSETRLSSGPYSTRQEAEEELLPIAADLLQRAFHEHHPWQGEWNVPLAQVRERVVEEFTERPKVISGDNSFDMYRVHMRVLATPEVCETFTESWKSQIVEQRLKVLGILLAWMSCVILLSGAYYRSLANPELVHRWAGTMKVSVLVIGLTVLAGWVLVTVIA